MIRRYVVYAKRDREERIELCKSASRALDRAAELLEQNWSDIRFVNGQAAEVPSSIVRQNAAEEQVKTGPFVAFKERRAPLKGLRIYLKPRAYSLSATQVGTRNSDRRDGSHGKRMVC